MIHEGMGKSQTQTSYAGKPGRQYDFDVALPPGRGGLAERGREGYNAVVQLNTSVCAPIAQWIERRPPEPGAQVQFLLGAPFFFWGLFAFHG